MIHCPEADPETCTLCTTRSAKGACSPRDCACSRSSAPEYRLSRGFARGLGCFRVLKGYGGQWTCTTNLCRSSVESSPSACFSVVVDSSRTQTSSSRTLHVFWHVIFVPLTGLGTSLLLCQWNKKHVPKHVERARGGGLGVRVYF